VCASVSKLTLARIGATLYEVTTLRVALNKRRLLYFLTLCTITSVTLQILLRS
jgi:hypothetical protein